MSRTLLLVGLPYAALAIFVAGIVWRWRSPFTLSSLSSQVLERRWLAWGTVPFHLGIAILFLGHLLPLIAPGWWQAMVSRPAALLTVEMVGIAAAIVTGVGLLLLLLRRLFSPMVRAAGSKADYAVLLILIVQVALGLGVASMHRWGSVWSARTTTPYLWSLVTFQPAPAFVAGVPMLMTLHLALAWILLALIPFTRLAHMLTAPLGYPFRRPQRIIWMSKG